MKVKIASKTKRKTRRGAWEGQWDSIQDSSGVDSVTRSVRPRTSKTMPVMAEAGEGVLKAVPACGIPIASPITYTMDWSSITLGFVMKKNAKVMWSREMEVIRTLEVKMAIVEVVGG